jgi:hypothetical protein
VKTTLKTFNPAGADLVDEAIKEVETQLGIDFHKDLFDALGSGVILFNAPTQGPFSLGYSLALEVKDGAKLRSTLERLVKVGATASGADMQLTSRKYRGVDMHTLRVGERGFPFAPSFVIHDGWLVVSLLPQPVQAYVMRSRGEGFSKWQPPELLSQAIRKAAEGSDGKTKLTSVSVVDSRPGLDSILALAPMFATFMQQLGEGGGGSFDPALLPNPKSITDLIGPSVSVGVDDGKTLRVESYSTFPVPLEFAGFDVYAYFFVAAFAFGRVGF